MPCGTDARTSAAELFQVLTAVCQQIWDLKAEGIRRGSTESQWIPIRHNSPPPSLSARTDFEWK